jgi:hypothetical protein
MNGLGWWIGTLIVLLIIMILAGVGTVTILTWITEYTAP